MLKKKIKQKKKIEYLHVHVYLCIRLNSKLISLYLLVGGFGTFHAWLNSFIHFMMYTYYGLAGLGPEYQKYLWWKKYMTKMQIVSIKTNVLNCTLYV